MGRFLSIAVVVLLVFAVGIVLVAPNYDLDPITLRGKLAVMVLLCAALVAASGIGACLLLRQFPLPLPPPPTTEVLPPVLDLTCCRLC